MLEHHAHLLPVGIDVHMAAGDLLALEENLTAFRLFQQIQAAQEGTLAAAGGADDGHHLALFNGFADAR